MQCWDQSPGSVHASKHSANCNTSLVPYGYIFFTLSPERLGLLLPLCVCEHIWGSKALDPTSQGTSRGLEPVVLQNKHPYQVSLPTEGSKFKSALRFAAHWSPSVTEHPRNSIQGFYRVKGIPLIRSLNGLQKQWVCKLPTSQPRPEPPPPLRAILWACSILVLLSATKVRTTRFCQTLFLCRGRRRSPATCDSSLF